MKLILYISANFHVLFIHTAIQLEQIEIRINGQLKQLQHNNFVIDDYCYFAVILVIFIELLV